MSTSKDTKLPFGTMLAKIATGETQSAAQACQRDYDRALALIKNEASKGLYQISVYALPPHDDVKRRLFNEGKFVFRTIPGPDFCEMLEVVMWDEEVMQAREREPYLVSSKAFEMFQLASKMEDAIKKAEVIKAEALAHAELRHRSLDIKVGRFDHMDEIVTILRKERIQIELETRQHDPFCDFEDASKYSVWVVRW